MRGYATLTISANNSISDTVVYYYQCDSATELPQNPQWSTTRPTWINGKYVWQKIRTNYEDGTHTDSTPVNITGQQGANGEDAAGLYETIPMYLASNVSTGITIDNSGWSRYRPELSSTNKYLWAYYVSRYTIGDAPPQSITATGSIANYTYSGQKSPVDNCLINITHSQSGTGDPSSSNIRTISGYTGVSINHSDTDTTSPDTITVTWNDIAGTIYEGTYDVTKGILTKTYDYIASYNGETLPSAWISDRDVYAEGTTPTTGAQIIYELATPVTYELPKYELNSYVGVNNFWASTGNTTIIYYDPQTATEPYIDYSVTSAFETSSDALNAATESLNKVTSVYGTCSTAASTATKQVVCPNFELFAGARISVKFTYENTSMTALDLKVANTASCPIYLPNNTQTSNVNHLFWDAGCTLDFLYDGTCWILLNQTDSLYGTCNTAADTRDKDITVNYPIICKGTVLSVKMINSNTASSPRLEIANNTKTIYTSADAELFGIYNWTANSTQTFVFDGQYWRITDETAKVAKTTATNYITNIENGIMVHPDGDGNSGWRIASAIELWKSGISYIKAWIDDNIPKIRIGRDDQGHIILDNDTVDVKNGLKTQASFGMESIIGEEGGNQIVISPTGMNGVSKNGTEIFNITQYQKTIGENTPVTERNGILSINNGHFSYTTTSTPVTNTPVVVSAIGYDENMQEVCSAEGTINGIADSIPDPIPSKYRNTYDEHGNVVRAEVYENGVLTTVYTYTYTYDNNGGLTDIKYYTNGQLIRHIYGGGLSWCEELPSTTYEENGVTEEQPGEERCWVYPSYGTISLDDDEGGESAIIHTGENSIIDIDAKNNSTYIGYVLLDDSDAIADRPFDNDYFIAFYRIGHTIHAFATPGVEYVSLTVKYTIGENTEADYAYYTFGTRGSLTVGNHSFAEGTDVIASGHSAHAEGIETTAKTQASHAEGYRTIANGVKSHAQNDRTIASGNGQTAMGKCNIEDADNDYALIIGNGTSESNRSNALAVTWDGDMEIALNISASSGTTDYKLYTALIAMGMTDVIV